ncbi:MAG: hypothetical protein H0W50_08070 [Parachlamydiaceae bacterium]|nr:hypothetical protein [Parachlamydiaceae bacterium]
MKAIPTSIITVQFYLDVTTKLNIGNRNYLLYFPNAKIAIEAFEEVMCRINIGWRNKFPNPTKI